MLNDYEMHQSSEVFTTNITFSKDNNKKEVYIYDWESFLTPFYKDIPSNYHAFEQIHHFTITNKDENILM